ncbi:MAG: methyltransferase [Jatrophihabitantaceae bacterium]
MLLDTAAPELTGLKSAELVVVGDRYGALTLAAAARFGLTGVRVHQDALTGELALAANAERFGLAGCYRSQELDAELFAGARLVLIQAPKSLDALREIVELICQLAPPQLRVLLGGRVKHLTLSMNEILSTGFEQVQPGLARQKSRVITATGVRAERPALSFPRKEWQAELGLWICAHGEAFAGPKLDLGTRRLLALLAEIGPAASTAIDLGCGTGVLAAALAQARPDLQVLATDSSAAAVASATATMAANGLADRVRVQRDDALASVPSGSAELIVCNPPFHLGNTVHEGAALRLFRAAGRVLGPGGQLWTVCNAHLDYRPALRSAVGPTRVVQRDPKFTVLESTKR